MNDYLPFNSNAIWHVAGWTMIHYLWLGSIVAAGALLSRVLSRRASPNVRYAMALCWLMVLASLPVGIAVWMNENIAPDPVDMAIRSADERATEALVEDAAPVTGVAAPAQGVIELAEAATASLAAAQPVQVNDVVDPLTKTESTPDRISSSNRSLIATLESCVPYLPWLWIVGTPLTFALLALGIVGTNRLRTSSLAIHEPRVIEMLDRLHDSLRVTRRVGAHVCERIAAPVLIGILRPIILLPPAALTGWSPEDIEMVLLHELAHVRRWDNLVNLVQRIIESLLFFHPAVWLVSNWVRREREACCDAIVVARTERPHAYAELLVALAAQMPRSVLFHPAASSAMAAGPLRNRIRRILGLHDDPMLISGKSLALVLAGLLIAATLAVMYLPTVGQAEQSTTEVTKDTEAKKPADARGDDAISNEGRTERRPEPQAGRKFPSLEEQKLADLVWKRLGLELEPIGDEDLKRVRALGYEGGLVVGGKPRVVAKIGADQTGDSIVTDDILVGLHVWPTTTMVDVAEVLKRDDLAELNPLKFYVVRSVGVEERVDRPPIMEDVVRTGRISVEFDEIGFGRGSAMPRQQMEAMQRMGMEPSTAAAMEPSIVAAKATPASDPDLPRYELPSAEVEAVRPSKARDPMPPLMAGTDRRKRSVAARAPSAREAAASKDNLRYDGKTFDEWRNAWQTELSTEKRIEAVKALAAFGRSGYGKEAAEAILDVAGQYDFYTWGDEGDGKVEETVLDELAPTYGSHALAEHWLPDLAARIEKEPKKWRWLAANLVSRLRTNDDHQLIEILYSFAETGPAEIRMDVLSALVRSRHAQSGGPQIDDKTRDLVARKLRSDNKETVRWAIRLLVYYPNFGGGGIAPKPQLGLQPELVPLLFHADEEIQRDARGVLRYIDKKDAPQIVRQLLAVLDDRSRKADHLHAIRGLASMGAQSREAIPTLRRVLTQSDDRELLLASLAAIDRIVSGYTSVAPSGVSIGNAMHTELTNEEIGAVANKVEPDSSKEFTDAFREAYNAVYPPEAQQTEGGGGFF
jgi:beta-lactamase regulating signal transducer with metallopeptidase domain